MLQYFQWCDSRTDDMFLFVYAWFEFLFQTCFWMWHTWMNEMHSGLPEMFMMMSIYCTYTSLTFTRKILIHSTFQSFSVAMFSIKDGYLCKQTIYMFMHRMFFDGSSFTVRKQLIRFSTTMVRASSPQNGQFALTIYSTMKNSRAFSHNCAFCLELLPCQLNWATQLLSAQPSNCCLVRATYWTTVTLEHLMTNLVGSRFFLPHT